MRFLKKHKKQAIIISAAVLVILVLLIAILVLNKEEPKPQPAPTPAPTATPAPTPTPEPTPEPLEIPIDFASWQAQNPHIYAWIRVPDTNIDYPLLQHPEDNEYYLKHTIYGEEKTEGSIYTENYNSMDFTDPNTIIYGHNMRNGSMFRTLHNFENTDFFNTHKSIYIYTPTQILEYRVFAAYVSDNAHLLYTYDFSNPNVFTEYLRAVMLKKGNIDTTINLNSANKIITLQTCTGNSETRYLVQAVLYKVSGEPDIIIPSTLYETPDAASGEAVSE